MANVKHEEFIHTAVNVINVGWHPSLAHKYEKPFNLSYYSLLSLYDWPFARKREQLTEIGDIATRKLYGDKYTIFGYQENYIRILNINGSELTSAPKAYSIYGNHILIPGIVNDAYVNFIDRDTVFSDMPVFFQEAVVYRFAAGLAISLIDNAKLSMWLEKHAGDCIANTKFLYSMETSGLNNG